MTSEFSQLSKQNGRIVPVLITWDVDPDSWLSPEKRLWAFNTAINLCNNLNIPATFYITAKSAEVYTEIFEGMMAHGHEVGCHGFTHGSEEDYNRMPEEMQLSYIQQATIKLQTLVGRSINSFRSPRVKTSATTLKLLVEHNYCSDSSVCSQRLDLVSSNLINVGWIFSPRQPYHPHQTSAFKRGNMSIWEIPVSAVMIPFISSAFVVLGLSAMKLFFRLLYAEARRTGKPIVYLAHPTEFSGKSGQKKGGRFWKRFATHIRLEYFSPSFIRTHGLRVRNLLYRIDGATLLNDTGELFSYISNFPGVKFMTMSEYVAHLDKQSLVPPVKEAIL